MSGPPQVPLPAPELVRFVTGPVGLPAPRRVGVTLPLVLAGFIGLCVGVDLPPAEDHAEECACAFRLASAPEPSDASDAPRVNLHPVGRSRDAGLAFSGLRACFDLSQPREGFGPAAMLIRGPPLAPPYPGPPAFPPGARKPAPAQARSSTNCTLSARVLSVSSAHDPPCGPCAPLPHAEPNVAPPARFPASDSDQTPGGTGAPRAHPSSPSTGEPPARIPPLTAEHDPTRNRGGIP